ncbi:MAG: hypothetical protein E6I52_30775 [Chloroflexi bacterium]|nr:MAG: hypothetical protein E6I52_30775 [Chloroflexota bacterium]
MGVHHHCHRRDAPRRWDYGHPVSSRGGEGARAGRWPCGGDRVCDWAARRVAARRGVVPVATAYSASEAFGFRKGVGLDFRRAPVFYGLFTVLLASGAAAALLPGIPLISLLIAVQTLNGLLLPVVLAFLLLLACDRRLMGSLRNTPVQSALGYLTLAAVTLADVALLVSNA